MKDGKKVEGENITNPVEVTSANPTATWTNISKDNLDKYSVIEVDNQGNPIKNNRIVIGDKNFVVTITKDEIFSESTTTYLPFTITNTQETINIPVMKKNGKENHKTKSKSHCTPTENK